MSDIDPTQQASDMLDADDDARPLTGEPVAPMRLRPEPPRVTRLSRKALAVLGSVAGVGLGGALIYALQIQQGGKPAEEVYATEARSTPDGLDALPKDYTGPVLGPPLPGDLGRPILNAQNRGQPVPVSGIDAPAGPAAPDPEVERRRQDWNGGDRSWRRRAPAACSSSPARRPRRQAACRATGCRTSPAWQRPDRPARQPRRTASLPSSTRPPTGAPLRPTA